MLKDLRRLADSVSSAELGGLSDDVSAGVGLVAEYAGRAVDSVDRTAAALDRAAQAHALAADAVRDLALLVGVAVGLVVMVWGTRQVRQLWG
jgi:hypothetical protein